MPSAAMIAVLPTPVSFPVMKILFWRVGLCGKISLMDEGSSPDSTVEIETLAGNILGRGQMENMIRGFLKVGGATKHMIAQ